MVQSLQCIKVESGDTDAISEVIEEREAAIGRN